MSIHRNFRVFLTFFGYRSQLVAGRDSADIALQERAVNSIKEDRARSMSEDHPRITVRWERLLFGRNPQLMEVNSWQWT